VITAEEFERAVGYPPEDDDMERANCNLAGNLTHSFCGWCLVCNKPRFVCLHQVHADSINVPGFTEGNARPEGRQ
jgi:hypothetical protein